MIKAQLHNGQTLKFPNGTSAQEIDRAVAEYLRRDTEQDVRARIGAIEKLLQRILEKKSDHADLIRAIQQLASKIDAAESARVKAETARASDARTMTGRILDAVKSLGKQNTGDMQALGKSLAKAITAERVIIKDKSGRPVGSRVKT
jgi:hypothetical protein